MIGRLLVTGGTGYLGRTVVRQALRQGWQVAGCSYSQPPLTALGATWFALDVRNATAVEEVCDTFQPDAIIHTAFRQNDPEMWEVTALGAEHVALAAHRRDIRLVHISTDVIFDGDKATPYVEADPPCPITPYGVAKADAERFVLAAHPTAALVRTSLIYGFDPMDRHTEFILSIADGTQSAALFTDEYRCPVLVDDLAAAVLELAENQYQGALNVAGTQRLSRYEFGVLLASFYGRDPNSIASGSSAASGIRRPLNCTLDVRLAQSILRTPLRGVAEVVETKKAGCQSTKNVL